MLPPSEEATGEGPLTVWLLLPWTTNWIRSGMRDGLAPTPKLLTTVRIASDRETLLIVVVRQRAVHIGLRAPEKREVYRHWIILA